MASNVLFYTLGLQRRFFLLTVCILLMSRVSFANTDMQSSMHDPPAAEGGEEPDWAILFGLDQNISTLQSFSSWTGYLPGPTVELERRLVGRSWLVMGGGMNVDGIAGQDEYPNGDPGLGIPNSGTFAFGQFSLGFSAKLRHEFPLTDRLRLSPFVGANSYAKLSGAERVVPASSNIGTGDETLASSDIRINAVTGAVLDLMIIDGVDLRFYTDAFEVGGRIAPTARANNIGSANYVGSSVEGGLNAAILPRAGVRLRLAF